MKAFFRSSSSELISQVCLCVNVCVCTGRGYSHGMEGSAARAPPGTAGAARGSGAGAAAAGGRPAERVTEVIDVSDGYWTLKTMSNAHSVPSATHTPLTRPTQTACNIATINP